MDGNRNQHGDLCDDDDDIADSREAEDERLIVEEMAVHHLERDRRLVPPVVLDAQHGVEARLLLAPVLEADVRVEGGEAEAVEPGAV